MNSIWQAASSVSSWFFGASSAQVASVAPEVSKKEDVQSIFSSFASKEVRERDLNKNLDIALNGNNLRNRKTRVFSNLAAAVDKSDVESVRRAIVSRLGTTGVQQHLAHAQLNKLVKQRSVIAF